MGKNEINGFLSYLATERHVSASTQNQALGALLFLYRYVLNMEVEFGNNIVWAKRSKHINGLIRGWLESPAYPYLRAVMVHNISTTRI